MHFPLFSSYNSQFGIYLLKLDNSDKLIVILNSFDISILIKFCFLILYKVALKSNLLVNLHFFSFVNSNPLKQYSHSSLFIQ